MTHTSQNTSHMFRLMTEACLHFRETHAEFGMLRAVEQQIAPTGPAVTHLRQNVAALLQQGHRRIAEAGGQLHPQQLFLLRRVVLNRM